ncbi:MAG: acetyltransferase [Salibacteraceae bacterium]
MACFILRDVIRYRSEIVEKNLRNSFPELSHKERVVIKREYYLHLSDIMLETVRLWAISKKELLKRVEFRNPEVLEAYESSDRNVIIMMGHSGNWEWAGAATAARFKFNMVPVYRKVKNPAINSYFLDLRSRFGSSPMVDKDCADKLPFCPTPSAVAMLADQSAGSRKGWWITFLNQKTPFFRGSEILSKRLSNFDVIFAHVHRAGRGRYSIELKPAPENWRQEKHVLTKSFAAFLEERIRQDKSNWLWSHNRWKHRFSSEYTNLDS